tara:strand:- start:2422 stop:2565 length:144 start_codon:yes stop_codon:yes gene_type:complete
VNVAFTQDQKIVTVNFYFKTVLGAKQNLVTFLSTPDVRPGPHDLTPN